MHLAVLAVYADDNMLVHIKKAHKTRKENKALLLKENEKKKGKRLVGK